MWTTLCENKMGAILQNIFCTFCTKKVIFGTQKMKNDIYKNNLKKLRSAPFFPIPRYTYVPDATRMGISW